MMRTFLHLSVFLTVLQYVTSLQFAVLSPNTFRIGVEETIGVTVSNSSLPVEVDVFIYDRSPQKKNIFRQTLTVQNGKPQITKFLFRPEYIPVAQKDDQHIFVNLTVKETKGKFSKEVMVPITKYSGYVFVQTDKPIYLPNQKVHIRTFSLDEKLIPSTKEITLEIKNPNGSRVYYKENRSGHPSGITEDTFTFSSSPVFGNWSVTVYYGYKMAARTTVRFEVRDYVLPTFSIKINIQKFFLNSRTNITGELTAKYVYGKPVQGYVNYKFAVRRISGQLHSFGGSNKIMLKDGKSNFSVRKKDILKGRIDWFPSIDKSVLVVKAEVVEQATGKREEAYDDNTIFTTSPYVISFSRSLKEFKPGVPYEVQIDIKYVNNQPLTERIPVKVSATAKKTGNLVHKLLRESTIQADLYGRAMSQFDTEKDFEELNIKVETVEDNQATAMLKVVRFNTSVPGTYVWIGLPREGTFFEVGKSFQTQVTVYPQEKNIKLMYLVVSRGTILMMNEMETQGEAIVRTIQFPVTVEMSPSFRLIVYIVNNGKIVVDSIKIDVEKTCKYNEGKEFTIKADAETVEPNKDVEFIIKGEENSVVAVGAVDEAVYLLSNRDVFTREKMFKELTKHDLGSGPGGGINPAAVFKNAGMLILSNNEIAEHGRTEGISQPKQRRKRSLLDMVDDYHGEAALCCRFGQFLGPHNMNCTQRAAVINESIGEKFNCSSAFLDCCEKTLELINTGILEIGRLNPKEQEEPLNNLIKILEEGVLRNVRKIFTETWFLNKLQIGDSRDCKGEKGECKFTSAAPHSITTWVVHAIGISQKTGICVADSTKIKVYKDFFVQLSLPPTAVKGEQIEALVTVFNYGKKEVEVNIYMFGVEGVCMGAGPGERTEIRKIKVPANNASSVNFPIMPLEVSEYSLRVVALSSSSSDAVEKKLRVVPEGYPIEKTISFTLDPNGVYSRRKRRSVKLDGSIKEQYDEENNKQSITVQLDLPKDHIPGTENCFITTVGDPVGQAINTTLSGLEGKFLKLPTGCGEQTMISLAPLVYTLFYLKKTNQMTKHVEKTGYNYMWQGYSNQLKYKKADGSYAIFPSSPSSTWLTAFVVKVFCQASNFIEIPPESINPAIKWLVNQQKANGAFIEAYRVSDMKMTGGIQGDADLTAYVLISMVECNKYDYVNERTSTNKAISFLENNISFLTRPYTIAIVAYALSLTNSSKRREVNEKLRNIAYFIPESYTRYWNWDASEFGTGPKPWLYQVKPDAVAVETTSYALLTQLEHEDLDYAHPIANWLNRQRSSSGAFVSTQDTVIALQALTEYNIKSKVPPVDITCNITSSHSVKGKKSIRIKKETSNSVEEIEVPAKGKLYFDVTGKGIAALSISLRFNVEKEPETKCQYDLTVISEEYNEVIEPVYVVPEYADNIIHAPVARQIFHQQILQEKFGHKVENEDEKIEDNANINRAGKDIDKAGSKHVIKLTICVKYLEKENAGMSIIDIGLFTGYKPIIEDLTNLYKTNETEVSEFEISDRSVVLYLNQVPIDKQICLSLRTSREVNVGKVQPTSVKVYNYYQPDKSCTTFYGPDKQSAMLKTICEGKQCVCAEGICPSCYPLKDVRKIKNDDERRKKLLDVICDRTTDFFWNGTLKNIYEEGSFKYFDFEVKEVLKEGKQNAREIEKETITFVGTRACQCPTMVVGEVYLIMSQDGFEYTTEDGETKLKYIFTKHTRIYNSRPLREFKGNPNGLKLQKTVNALYNRFKGGNRCLN